MAVWVLIGFWVAAGLGVLFVAMTSTRRRRSAARPSHASGRLAAVGFAVFFVGLGILVPAAIMVSNSDADGNARGGVDLTAGEAHGRELFAEQCATCHTLAASNAVGKVGPDLDKLRPAAELTVNAVEEGRARGQGQMPAGLVRGQDARDVADYIAAVAGR